jgi:carboxylate-amine ligase
VRLREHLLDTLDRIAPDAARLDTRAPLEAVWKLAQAQHNDTHWLRERYAELKSMPDLVRQQALRWKEGAAAEPARAAGGRS